ncbi:PHB depolymerase family esterase [Herbaspirillum sp. WKF16]|uniref:extracellular catalytic domain type 1 short-chain-length polyhydroxyalkanoate depolymerase n=1 Tax=Herbaspirillum sp. WKF16 TaxID=3028312 RepID=UPI0023A9FA26|nr:PHB depolymerase family esterase [Herbaspirillum sp. WKF16]WDZ96703.1 PHB depolymerase family esterase [Herbaspirillum sp. WKF16]
MLKKVKRLWFSGMKKAAKAQQKHVKTMLKMLVAKPSPAAAKSRRPGSKRSAPTVAPPGSWMLGRHSHDAALARRMQYRLFLPDRHGAGAPLIVMLHGCQQNAADFAEGTRMNAHAARKGYAVLYPEQSLGAHAQRCWKWYDPATQRGEADVAMIAALVEDIAARHAIDRRRVYACGLSAGAAMAQLLALTHPGLVAAVGLHSGPAYGGCKSAAGAYRLMQAGAGSPLAAMDELLAVRPAAAGVPAILIAGDADKVVRPINHRQLTQQFVRLNRESNLEARPLTVKAFGRVSKKNPVRRRMLIGDYVSGRTPMVRSVLIEGLGHAWSGGDEKFAFNSGGPDATKMVLDFFARHRLR